MALTCGTATWTERGIRHLLAAVPRGSSLDLARGASDVPQLAFAGRHLRKRSLHCL